MISNTVQSILQGVSQPVLVIDLRERILAANPPCEELLGPELVGRHYATIIRQPNLLELIDRTFTSGTSGDGRYLATSVGHEATYAVRATPYSSGEDGGLVLSFEDMTPVEKASQMRRNFIANASHELRTPLTALQGFIETLKGPARDDAEARDRFLDIMASEATRMNRLVRDLLSLTRVEAEERLRPATKVDVVRILRHTMNTLEGLIRSAGVELVFEPSHDSFEVDGDEDQLTQVFQNLLENAVKYGGNGKRISVSVSIIDREPVLRSRCISICVRDEGEGIDPAHIPRLTERFYRVDNHRSRQMGGTGLGLAIVKHIVNRHRGRLRIESTLGAGSRFSVFLPAA
ncbi:MAG: ATP-binding protein [Brevirhabdus sp.]